MSPTITGYDYPPPSKGDVMDSLRRVLGADEAQRAWDHACDVAKVDAKAGGPSLADLTAVSRALIQLGGLRSVVGNSMSVRILTYSMLSDRKTIAVEATKDV